LCLIKSVLPEVESALPEVNSVGEVRASPRSTTNISGIYSIVVIWDLLVRVHSCDNPLIARPTVFDGEMER
jgi:hypothetical protein